MQVCPDSCLLWKWGVDTAIGIDIVCLRVYKNGMARIEEGPLEPIEKSKGPLPTPEKAWVNILELIGDPKRVAQELQEFSERMRREKYDPHPDKTLILGRQARVKRAA